MCLIQETRHDREAGGAMVAPPSQPGQAFYASEVLREYVEMYLLLVQLLLRLVHTVGQGMALERRYVLYRVSSSGTLLSLMLSWYFFYIHAMVPY